MSATLTICVASFNTCAATELCVRSIAQHADHPYSLRVGDSGSTDGSVAMLEEFQDRGWLVLERANETSTHAEWLDRWRHTCDSRFILYVDSDIEFRRPRWLRGLMTAVINQGAAIAYAQWLPPSLFTLDGRQLPVVGRPAPWLLLIDAEQTADLRSSFAVHYASAEAPSAPPTIYDVGACFFYEAVARGLQTFALPSSFKRHFQHYGGLSWLPTAGARGQKKLRDQRTVERRLRHLQRLQSSTSMTSRLSAAAQLAATPQDALDIGFRIRAGVTRRCESLVNRRSPG